MTITNNSLSQSFNAIFRDGITYSEAQIQVLVQKEGNITVRTYTPDNLEYRPNYVVINFTVEESNQFQDGEEYMIRVINDSSQLISTERMIVSINAFDASKQNIPNNDYITAESSNDDYIILNNDGEANTPVTSEADSYDTDNDGYGNYNRVGLNFVDISENIVGEFTVDTTNIGTFTTAPSYTSVDVEKLPVGQPSDVGNTPFFSQYGLADGMNGYVRYSEGWDKDIAYYAFRAYMQDVNDRDGNNIGSLENSGYNSVLIDTIYKDSSKTGFSIGDSVYSDNSGTKLADGTTNLKDNRYWFLFDGKVIKVTSGVVTHTYDWINETEGIAKFNGGFTMAKQELIDGDVITTNDSSIPLKGKEWVGDESTGSLVTTNTLQDAGDAVLAKLNDGYAIIQSNEDGFYLDYRSSNNPFSDKLQVRNLGPNSYRLLKDDLKDYTFELIDSYKTSETTFMYLPVYGTMSAHYQSTDGKGVIVLEHNKYTGQIVDHQIVFKTNN